MEAAAAQLDVMRTSTLSSLTMVSLIRGALVSLLLGVFATACAETPSESPAKRELALGFAVDTTAVPGAWWGVDSARIVLPEIVRTWREYLLVRHIPAQRAAFWTAADRARALDPDPLPTSESYLLDGRPLLIEALPLVAGDASRWVLRTVYVGGGTADHPGLLGMERTYIVRETGTDGKARWALASPVPFETAGWTRASVGRIDYVVHPSLSFARARATATAAWTDSLTNRFSVPATGQITYFQVPDLQTGNRVIGLEWVLSGDRAGGRASPVARIVLAANPRYAEAYKHELVHVLLHPLLGGRSAFVSEGVSYWLGGARGLSFIELMRDLGSYLEGQPTLTLASILAEDEGGPATSAQFPAAAAIFELAHRRSGDQLVRRLIDTLGSGSPTVADVARALDTTASELESDWRTLVTSYAR